jgi:hypothetical protein
MGKIPDESETKNRGLTRARRQPIKKTRQCLNRERFRQLERMHATENFLFAAVPGELKILISLNAHPKLWRNIEKPTKFERHFRADRAFAADDFTDGNGRAANRLRYCISRQAKRLHKIFTQDIAGMNGVESVFSLTHISSMIIHDLWKRYEKSCANLGIDAGRWGAHASMPVWKDRATFGVSPKGV